MITSFDLALFEPVDRKIGKSRMEARRIHRMKIRLFAILAVCFIAAPTGVLYKISGWQLQATTVFENYLAGLSFLMSAPGVVHRTVKYYFETGSKGRHCRPLVAGPMRQPHWKVLLWFGVFLGAIVGGVFGPPIAKVFDVWIW